MSKCSTIPCGSIDATKMKFRFSKSKLITETNPLDPNTHAKKQKRKNDQQKREHVAVVAVSSTSERCRTDVQSHWNERHHQWCSRSLPCKFPSVMLKTLSEAQAALNGVRLSHTRGWLASAWSRHGRLLPIQLLQPLVGISASRVADLISLDSVALQVKLVLLACFSNHRVPIQTRSSEMSLYGHYPVPGTCSVTSGSCQRMDVGFQLWLAACWRTGVQISFCQLHRARALKGHVNTTCANITKKNSNTQGHVKEQRYK